MDVAYKTKSSPRTSSKETARSSPATTTGLDLSHWNTGFDPRRARQPVGFVIIKSSEGTAVDPSFEQLYRSSVGRVPIIGSYHYLRSNVGMTEQLRTAMAANAGKRVDFYAVDFESQGNVITPEFAQQAVDYVNQLHAVTGRPVYLYTGQSFYDQYFRGSGVPLWLAAPTGVYLRDIHPTFVQTQWNAPGAQYGVASRSVDVNVFPGSLAQLRQSLASGQPPQFSGPLGGQFQTINTSKSKEAGSNSQPTGAFASGLTSIFDATRGIASAAAGAGGAAVAASNQQTGGSPLVSVNLLPANITSFLSSPDIGTTILFVVIGLILLIVGLFMLKGGAPASA